jgi:hypothetical protein
MHLQSVISEILRIVVSASDQSLTAVIPVFITIVDINDNAPIFNNLPRALSISEVCENNSFNSCS